MTTETTKTKDPRFIELQEKLKRLIGPRLSQARTDMGLSQDDVLKELEKHGAGRTQGSISQIEKGMRLPSLEIFYVMVKLYDSSANYTLGLSTDTRSLTDIEEELAAARGEGGLNVVMSQLPKDKQQEVVDFAEFLLSRQDDDRGKGNQGGNTPLSPKRPPSTGSSSRRNNRTTGDAIGSGDDEQASSDLAALQALLRVMERKIGKDELEKIIEEVAESIPEWEKLAIATGTSSKDTGIQGG